MSIAKNLLAATALAGAIGLGSAAQAEIINFEQFTGPSVFSSASPPLTIMTATAGNVTFTGGQILTGTTNLPADESTVYGAASFQTGGVDPITITFSSNINNFFLNLYNGLGSTQSYRVADNLGHSTTVSLAPNLNGGTSLISFPALGNVVTVEALNHSSFDFFIDNIGFNQATPGVPEPASWAMMLAGFGALGVAMRRNKDRTAVTFG